MSFSMWIFFKKFRITEIRFIPWNVSVFNIFLSHLRKCTECSWSAWCLHTNKNCTFPLTNHQYLLAVTFFFSLFSSYLISDNGRITPVSNLTWSLKTLSTRKILFIQKRKKCFLQISDTDLCLFSLKSSRMLHMLKFVEQCSIHTFFMGCLISRPCLNFESF